jgi:hypothetical protein
MKSTILRSALIVLIALMLLAGGWLWLTLTWSYSQGERAGYVQKLSKKGWLCKTWEGEIAMVTMPGAIPEKFNFTVRNEGVAQKINLLAGKRVVLDYQQHRYIPLSCFGETEYFIEDVREVVDTPPPQAPAAPLTPSAAQGQLTAPR